MADEHDKKKEEKKPSDHGIQVDQSFMDWLVHRMMDAVIPWGAGKVRDAIATRGTAATEKPKHLASFGEALLKLYHVNKPAYDVIRHFQRFELQNDTDRDDFQVRSSKIGGADVNVTVAFLQLVAAEPNHKSRRLFLEEMGFLGGRAVDPIEKAKILSKKVYDFAARSGNLLDYLKADATAAGVVFDRMIEDDTAHQEAILRQLRSRRR